MSVNALRDWHGLGAVDRATVMSWIGGGIDALLAASVPSVPVDAELRQRFLAHYKGNPLLESKPYPGIVDLLDRLREAEIPCAIITNKHKDSVELLIQKLGWQARFGAIVCPDGDLKKPDPRFVALAAARLGAPLGLGTMVGDSEFDIAAARAAGLNAVAVTWGYRSRDILAAARPDWIVDTVAALETTLHGNLPT